VKAVETSALIATRGIAESNFVLYAAHANPEIHPRRKRERNERIAVRKKQTTS